jgi:autotransporter translocation and assembly factor TamB
MTHRFIFRLTSVLLLLTSTALAQTTEPEWRVVNVQPARAVPVPEQPASPFPRGAEVVAPVSATVIDPEALEEANKINAVRSLLTGVRLTEPNFATVRIHAYLAGPQGGAILVEGSRWLGVGKTLRVQAKASPQVAQAMQTLAAFDSADAETVKQQLRSKAQAASSFDLTITALNATQATLRDAAGRTYRLALPRQE